MGGFQTDLLDKLMELGFIPPDEIQTLKSRAASRGTTLAEAALLENILHSDAKGWILAEALGIPFIEIDPESVPMSLCDVIPEAIAREHLVAPIALENDRLTLAVSDPFCHEAFSSVEAMTGLSVRIAVCPHRILASILSRFYPDLFQLAPADLSGGLIGSREAEKWISQGGVRRLAEKALIYAASTKLENVRMFPAGEKVLLKGKGESGSVLLLSFPLKFRRILIDAFLDLAEAGKGPERMSGKIFQLESASGVVSFRLSFVQGLSGVEAIIKILPDRKSGITLDSVGLNQEQVDITRKVLSKGSGFFLVSSPGPEGVATTLFTLLRDIYRTGTRVVTVEEQFQLRNEGYIQLERRYAEQQFEGKWPRLAESLEPDVLMIEHVSDPGEFSDLIHLAQGGITVLCGVRRFNFDRTLRTLLSLDVDPFILARVVRLVMHQRLVNLLCQECRRPVPAKPSLRMVGERYRTQLERIIEDSSFYVPAGCERCKGKGYSGKMALVELLPFTPGVENIVSSDVWLEEKLGRLLEEDFYSAIRTVEDLLLRGMVTYDEVLPFFR
ncbi:MAG: Flp pilus assembly complex ATPase component TadA [Deltaproteobacteria bacterium]|nr:Flp pilus assembly complex ATPase component TadA [Deltaproteobacteria bacterium]